MMIEFKKWMEEYGNAAFPAISTKTLYIVFTAGVVSEYIFWKKQRDTLQKTIDWYEGQVRKLKAENREKDLQLQQLQDQLSKTSLAS